MSAIRKNTTPAMQAVRYAVLGILTVLFNRLEKKLDYYKG